jgi:hypothetical protein
MPVKVGWPKRLKNIAFLLAFEPLYTLPGLSKVNVYVAYIGVT